MHSRWHVFGARCGCVRPLTHGGEIPSRVTRLSWFPLSLRHPHQELESKRDCDCFFKTNCVLFNGHHILRTFWFESPPRTSHQLRDNTRISCALANHSVVHCTGNIGNTSRVDPTHHLEPWSNRSSPLTAQQADSHLVNRQNQTWARPISPPPSYTNYRRAKASAA